MMITDERKPVCWCFSMMENSDASCDYQMFYYTSEEKAREAMNTAVENHINICGKPAQFGDPDYDEDTNCIIRNRNKVMIKDGMDKFIWTVDPVIPIE